MSSLEQPTTRIPAGGGDGGGTVILDRYELTGQIGRGGFSTVYRAWDRKMQRQVAVKAVRRTEELTGRAAHEAKAAAKLSHPHIVTVFELAEDADGLYLVSELVEGKTLTERIASASLTDREAVDVARQVLEALEHAHGRGVIHRDIKPDNIMLAEGRGSLAKVMDFGIAQLENTQRLTRQGDVIGTLAYMSPEQADGRALDGATDVYSTALTLYECLAGENPFRASGAAETVARISAGAAPLSQLRPDLPRELSRLVEQAMDPDPLQRLGLRSFAAGLAELAPELGTAEQATTVLRRADRPRPAVYDDVARRYGHIAARAANAGLALMVAWVAAYDSSYYPSPWRLPLVLGAAAAVALLPRLGMAALAVVALLPVISYSVALGAILAAVVGAYYLMFGLLWPRVALLPALAVALGVIGGALAFPAIAGSVGKLRRGPVLAMLGGIAFVAGQLALARRADFPGLAGSFDLKALSGSYNPVQVLRALAEPLRQQPVIMAQPGIWLAAALPAALLVRRRSRTADFAGLFLSDAVLVGGYLALPSVFAGFRLPAAAFVKTLVLCVIIQVVLLLLSPRISLPVSSPHERT
ncbi:MAG: serine/threonine-protein kinase [Actinomycetota bacterium]|nr:serine/threonine protein kinase [Actinomycetota bacterium]MDA8166574.1 serine/threonine-protein kinase [Actinomycetota bacterium]